MYYALNKVNGHVLCLDHMYNSDTPESWKKTVKKLSRSNQILYLISLIYAL